MLARLPDRSWTLPEIRRIARRLVELLPATPKGSEGDQIASIGSGKLDLRASPLLIYIALALLGALVFGLMAQGYRTSGDHESTSPVPLADPTIPTAPMR
jgi:hypothetical protein